jgi:hypothetical protein
MGVDSFAPTVARSVNGGGARVNFPSCHPLSGTGTGTPDGVLSLEVQGIGAPTPWEIPATANAKAINISSLDLFIKSNLQDFQHLPKELLE